ncbi:MAG: helix-turn-helix domain-containing protein [Nanoarchaeota archaeon]
MNQEKSLEETIKEKVSVLLEEIMEKSWGIAIPKVESDITDQLKSPQLNVYLPPNLRFSEAKKKFKAEFLKNELRLHRGNVSQLARFLEVDRRSLHRFIRKTGINVDVIRSQEEESGEKYRESLIDKTIRSALEEYREIIRPQKMERIYLEVPALSRNIARILPHQHLSWKEAGREFERQFLHEALSECQWNVSRAAEKLDIRVETLHRKIKKLGLSKSK